MAALRSPSVKGPQRTAFDKHHLFKRFAARELSKDGREQRPQQRGGTRIRPLSPRGVARDVRKTVEGLQVACGTLLGKVEPRGACAGKQRAPGHQGIREGHPGLVTAVIRDGGAVVAQQGEQRISGKMCTCFGGHEAPSRLHKRAIASLNRWRHRHLVALRCTQSQR